MIKAIIVDDEILSINKLKHVLTPFEDITVAGCFADPCDALEKAPGLLPQLVFLDIEMPDMNGLALAEKMAERLPGAEIVFATAHDEYALNAFEVAAVDYLLKPVTKERIAEIK